MTKPYDKNKIGKFVGWGGEHFVYEYGDKEVIKFSVHVWLSGKSAVEKKKKDYEIGKKYFDKYLIPIKILTWDNGKKAVEIQEKIKCRFLKSQDLKNEKVKEQFDDIAERHHRMVTDVGVPFDLFGREGLLKIGQPKKISNILITPTKELVLIDFTLLELKPKIREWPLWLIIQWAKGRQRKLFAEFSKSEA